jgi:uncharacterized damage-inducible protein DinB
MGNGFSNIKGMFRANTDVINKAIGDIRDEDWFRKPGDDSNHLLWLLGHVIVHRAYVLKILGVDWNTSWSPLFARGAERIADTEYPPIEEMRTAWSDVSEKLRGALRETAEDVLTKPAPEGPPSFDKQVGGTVAFFAFHDTYHAGQLSYLRKWLGYGQTVG